MKRLERFTPRTRIAYLSMEMALRPEIHTYSGGLGVLAGDILRSAADLSLPMVFVTLISRGGYFRQELDAAGRQSEAPDPWEVERWCVPLSAMSALTIEGREVWVRPWLYVHEPTAGSAIPVLLLDTDLEQNDARDREITQRLYGGDAAYRLKQETVLGIGGARLLQALGFEISTYHLNEGHAALLPVELLRRRQRQGPRNRTGEGANDTYRFRELCVFTTHTPVEAGHDVFDYDLVSRVAGELLPGEELKAIAGSERLNMTRIALNLSGYVNGVAHKHAATTQSMFPGYDIQAITNGVHAETWLHPAFKALCQSIDPLWARDPTILFRTVGFSDDAVWQAHATAKKDLCDMVRRRTGVKLEQNVPIIGFARRMTGYKRPDLLFSDLDRLRSIARTHPFQVVMAGKAHPRDFGGKELIERVFADAKRLDGSVPVVFIPNYDLETAGMLVSGSDIWLNTPLPPLEASGTSGMKAGLNGVLNLSTLDGWWLEGSIEGYTGWAIEGGQADGAEAEALYRKLGEVVLPLYYKDRSRWIAMMKQSAAVIGSHFNSHETVRRYAAEAYQR